MSSAELLRGAPRRTARYARMTAEDVTELSAVFWQVARRQARDAAAGLGPLLGRWAERARRAAASRR